MELVALLRREATANLRPMIVMNIISAVTTAAMLAEINSAAEATAAGKSTDALLILFLITMFLFAISHNYVLLTSSHDIEYMIHRMRVALFDEVRHTDPPTLEQVGRSALHAALTQDSQTLARTLPLLAVGLQQAVMLLFIGVYMAWLSPVAFILSFGFSGLAVAIRFQRMRMLGQAMRASMIEEAQVFDGLTDLLHGFKEVRMSKACSDGLMADLAAVSTKARKVKTKTKSLWGQEFALLQSLFYILIGLVVFVVPLFSSGYDAVVVQITTLALFIVGPIGTLAHVTPMVSETEAALGSIKALRTSLRHSRAESPDESARPLPGPTKEIALDGVCFSYPGDGDGPGFTVGPLTAFFRAGEITFITGGNGSGKSTLLRLLTGLIPPQQGRLSADGAEVEPEQLQAYRDRISAVFSDLHLSRRLYGIVNPDPVVSTALLARLEMTGKVSIANNCFSTVNLSSGQRKRLALLVTELEAKPVLVLDEWAADQDPHFRKIFYEQLLPEFRARGRIVVCVTHDDHYFSTANRILHMDEGRLTVVGDGPL
ncbi:MAG: ATP-binding cassette domain-containing protein [Rhodospirillaceae bacterium]